MQCIISVSLYSKMSNMGNDSFLKDFIVDHCEFFVIIKKGVSVLIIH